jgi:putative transposase
MSQTCSPSTQRRYGLARVCRVWELARSTVYLDQARRTGPVTVSRKRGPKPRWSDGKLLDEIRAVLDASPFLGEGHRKVWARLRWQGVRTSKARVLRLMREAKLLAPTRAGHAHGPKAHDGTITTERPDVLWGVDATSGLTRREGTATVFVVVDHCASECVGLHAAKPGTRFEAVEPLRQGIQAVFDGYEAGIARGLSVRHDHGSQYVSDYFQDELTFLGITASPAFVREPEGNGYASHCTSLQPLGTISAAGRRRDSFTPWALRGAWAPGGA